MYLAQAMFNPTLIFNSFFDLILIKKEKNEHIQHTTKFGVILEEYTGYSGRDLEYFFTSASAGAWCEPSGRLKYSPHRCYPV
jgi:hypothetical protein